MNGDYYIDMSVDNSYDMLKNNNSMNIGTKQYLKGPLNEYNNDNKRLIEGFGQFGSVNLQKCCPVNYMWSEKLKKCIKICDSCGVSAYGKINYEFLHNHGDEFFTYTTCEGDASGSYDYDKINKRYDKSELLNQYDMNIYGGGQGVDSEVQAAEENPWTEFSSYLDPEKDTSPGREAARIEAEHNRRRDASERGEFTQRLEILDKDMYYISSEITDQIRGAVDLPNNPWPEGLLPGSWKMKNFSEWLSSEGKVSPIMHSLGTEFIPNKIIDPMRAQDKPENIGYIQNLLREMDGGNDNEGSIYGPVYHYYKDYLVSYSGDNSDNERREILKGKRNIMCDAFKILKDSIPVPVDFENQFTVFREKYCGDNNSLSPGWDELCTQPVSEQDSELDYPDQWRSAVESENLETDWYKNELCIYIKKTDDVTLPELCEGVEDIKLCV